MKILTTLYTMFWLKLKLITFSPCSYLILELIQASAPCSFTECVPRNSSDNSLGSYLASDCSVSRSKLPVGSSYSIGTEKKKSSKNIKI